MRQQLVEEKQAQIKTLLDRSVSAAKYYREQKNAGTLKCEEAQAQVKKAIGHLCTEHDYFFFRIRDHVIVTQTADALRQIHASSEQSLIKTRGVANSAHEQHQASISIAVNIEKIVQMVESSNAAMHSAQIEFESDF